MNTKFALKSAAAAVIAVSAVILSLGGFTVNHERRVAELLPLDGVVGAESLVFDADGEGPYIGVSDGRILKWDSVKQSWVDFAASPGHLSDECRGSQNPKSEDVCGRPLGLQFNKKKELYVADAYLGLMKVAHNETHTTPVTSQAHGLPFLFANGLDIAQDSGEIYFTYSSTRFQRREFMSVIISGDNTGRLMMYDPESKKVQVLLEGLSFANGLAISHDKSFLIIAETKTCRILKYKLESPMSTSFEVLAELPGFPDNIKRSPRGGYWVAFHARRTGYLKWLLSHTWLGEQFLQTGFDVQRFGEFVSSFTSQAFAARISDEGEVLEILEGLEGLDGQKISFISEVQEHAGYLWFGSVLNPFVGRLKL